MSTPSTILVERIAPTHTALKIAVVTETYPPDINGVAHTLSKIVLGLRERGHVVWLVRPRQQAGQTADHTTNFEEVLVRGMPIPFYKQLRMGLPAKRELLKLWTRQRPDVVHIATEGPLGWSALQAARKLKLPVSTDFRTNFHAYSQHYGLAWLSGAILAYMKKFHNSAHATMVPTANLAHELGRKGFKGLHVVPRGVETQLFSPTKRDAALRAQWGVQGDSPVMLYVGRIAVEKNLQLVIKTYQAAKQLLPGLRLVMVGDGPMRAELEQAQDKGIIFAGFRTGEDLARHYASADVFVFASKTETFGNVTLEAMASGLAVVAFDHAAAGDIIRNGVNGMLADPESEPSFVMAAQSLLNAPENLRAIGLRAAATAAGMGWPSIVEATEAIMRAVVWQEEMAGMPSLGSAGLAAP